MRGFPSGFRGHWLIIIERTPVAGWQLAAQSISPPTFPALISHSPFQTSVSIIHHSSSIIHHPTSTSIINHHHYHQHHCIPTVIYTYLHLLFSDTLSHHCYIPPTLRWLQQSIQSGCFGIARIRYPGGLKYCSRHNNPELIYSINHHHRRRESSIS